MTLAEAIESDYKITYTNQDGYTQVLATLEDDPSGPGVFLATFTLTKIGTYTLQILLRGLEVPTLLTESLTVYPTVTSAVTSEFTGNLVEYRTGDFITIVITARDEFNNLRGSTDDDFTLIVTGQSSTTQYGPFTAKSLGDGTYTVDFMFTKVDLYTIELKLASSQ